MGRDSNNNHGDTDSRGVQNGIPRTRDQRDHLLNLICRYVTANDLVPPLEFPQLLEHAEGILKTAGLDPECKEYAAVLCNNEVWRDSLASVPYDRRLLLLPLCLRDEDACEGELDEFGLVCKQCSSCAIGDLTCEAEKLGYVTLACEGTTMVMSLIESGKIEAIVGVGCLSSLRKVYPLMAAAAIPGIAIPLLRDGCVNTEADMDWIREAIVALGPQRTTGPSMDTLRHRVGTWFTPERMTEVLGPAGGETETIAREWLMRSGKRWRPLLTACTFHALVEDAPHDAGDDRTADLMRVAIAVECFHKASLVHDDIEDADPLRYGQKTMHEQHGVPVAVNIGDFLIGEGYRLIAECGAPAEVKAQLLHVAAAGHRNLCMGQGSELCWRRDPAPLTVDEITEIYTRKTAPAFEVAIQFGAVLAGGGPEVAEVLQRYSKHLGVAYQIRDDLDDLRGADGGDSAALRPSILLAMAYEVAAGADRDLLDAAWRQTIDPRRADELADRITGLGALDAARERLEFHRQQAAAALEPLTQPGLKRLLRQVLGRIFHGQRKGGRGESDRSTLSSGGRGAGSAA